MKIGSAEEDIRDTLRRLEDERDIQGLISYVADPESLHLGLSVRQLAIAALGRIGDSAAVGVLASRLHDADEDVRFATVTALGRIDGPEACHLLVRALGDRARVVRAQAAFGLAECPNTASALREALRDSDPWVRVYAAEALAIQGDSSAINALTETLQLEPRWRRARRKRIQDAIDKLRDGCDQDSPIDDEASGLTSGL
jgi:HEAT repeat protein